MSLTPLAKLAFRLPHETMREAVEAGGFPLGILDAPTESAVSRPRVLFTETGHFPDSQLFID